MNCTSDSSAPWFIAILVIALLLWNSRSATEGFYALSQWPYGYGRYSRPVYGQYGSFPYSYRGDYYNFYGYPYTYPSDYSFPRVISVPTPISSLKPSLSPVQTQSNSNQKYVSVKNNNNMMFWVILIVIVLVIILFSQRKEPSYYY